MEERTVPVLLTHDEIAEMIDAIETGLSAAHAIFALIPIPDQYRAEVDLMRDILAKLAVAHDEIGCPAGDAAPIPFVITEEGRGAL